MNSPGQAHVLVLDPDHSIRALLVAVLRRSGLRVTACGTEEGAAEECVRRARYAAVILSADMPRLDTLLHELRLPPRDQGPRVILTTTAHATAHATDADAVLWKPFDLAELQAAIAACCGIGGDGGSAPRRGNDAVPGVQP